MFKVFIISFGIVSLIYALLAAFTSTFYRNKYPEQLSHLERNLLFGRASIGDRAMLFLGNLVLSVRYPPAYIIAGIMTLIFWIIISSVPQQVDQEGLDTSPSTKIFDDGNITKATFGINEDTITYVYFKDGIKVPKYEFLSSCIISMNEISGGLFDAKKVCPCMIEKLTAEFTSKEYAELMFGEDSVENVSNFYNSETGKMVLSDCLSSNINPNSNSKMDYPAGFKEQMVKQLKFEIQKEKEFCDLVDVDKYCECMVDKIMKKYTLVELMNTSMSPSNPVMDKAREDCFKESLKKQE